MSKFLIAIGILFVLFIIYIHCKCINTVQHCRVCGKEMPYYEYFEHKGLCCEKCAMKYYSGPNTLKNNVGDCNINVDDDDDNDDSYDNNYNYNYDDDFYDFTLTDSDESRDYDYEPGFKNMHWEEDGPDNKMW